MNRSLAFLLVVLLGAAVCPATSRATYIEPPFLEAAVAKGTLPPIERRLPAEPLVVPLDQDGLEPGGYGGDLRILMSSAKDVRMMVVYGYARLVVYDRRLQLVPDILEKVDIEEGRVFTLHLRPGHRWSDGEPFTAEDFRYFWEDVANSPDLSPMGLPAELMVDAEPPTFTVIDPLTVRYSWSKPNPGFLPALAGPAPLYIYRPAHYLKQFHPRYADPAKLKEKVERSGQRNWAALHGRKDNQYKNDNPDLPTLDPWVNTTKGPAERFVFVRNPYYHRVDRNGRQLPYIDRVVMQIADGKIIPAKVGAGEADLQARYLRFDHYTFLKAGEERGHYQVRLWHNGYGSQIALYPNLNTKDPVWRTLFRDVRFRRALSLGLDRHEINQVIYYGLAEEGQDTVLPQSPLFRPEYRTAWADFDPDRANRLLDEIGLPRGEDEVRLLPDGRPLEIIVESAGEGTEETDVLRLIADSWERVGIKLFVKVEQREVFRNRIFSGDEMMAVWWGLENGVANADSSPGELAPTSQQQLQWPKWGQHYETMGRAGAAVDTPEGLQLMALYREWRDAKGEEDKERVWHDMLAIRADQLFTIGTVAAVPQPVVVSTRLRNVPADGLYSWEPGAHLGMHRPDCFWFAPETAEAAQAQ
jgi:peptide/nickel transport system substrate-binding protein